MERVGATKLNLYAEENSCFSAFNMISRPGQYLGHVTHVHIQQVGHSQSQRMFKLNHLLKSYGYAADWVDFVDWWSCVGKGLHAALEAVCLA